MRWYKIIIDGGPTFDATGDPNALNVEMDIPVAPGHIRAGAAFCRVWGIPLQTILTANKLNNLPISVYGGMQQGLPLANPAQQGLLVYGSVFPALGNWVNTDMTLDLYIGPPLGASNPNKTANIIHSWAPGTPLGTAIQQTLKTAFPNFNAMVNISPNLVTPNQETGFYQTLTQFADYVFQRSKSILGAQKNYQGVNMVLQGKNIIVDDGTTTPSGPTINPWDLIGQPIWTGTKSIQFKTVMRGDLSVATNVTLPKTLSTLTNTAGGLSPNSGSNLIQGTFFIQQMRHTGNFRQPDWASWATTVDAVQL